MKLKFVILQIMFFLVAIEPKHFSEEYLHLVISLNFLLWL